MAIGNIGNGNTITLATFTAFLASSDREENLKDRLNVYLLWSAIDHKVDFVLANRVFLLALIPTAVLAVLSSLIGLIRSALTGCSRSIKPKNFNGGNL